MTRSAHIEQMSKEENVEIKGEEIDETINQTMQTLRRRI